MSTESPTLQRLNERLNSIERRLSDLDASKVVLDERKVVARKGEFEGKTYTSNEDGGIIKEVRVPVCDSCGVSCDKFNSCTICQKKLCPSCSILYQKRVCCSDCLNEAMPLTKQEYKVLTAIASNLQPSDIEGVSGLRSSDVEDCIVSLAKKQMIENKGFLFFNETKILEKGLEALNVYLQVYDKEGDVQTFESELWRVLDEKG